MTLRPEYSLGHSAYNAFLFAAVGEEKVGLPLTVLTALTRLGFDPWREAARLSDLPKETASRVFAVTIAMLPEGDWKASDSEAIAARLVNCLPERSAEVIPSVGGSRAAGVAGGASQMVQSRAMMWLTWSLLAVALVLLGLKLFSNYEINVGRGRVDTTIESALQAGLHEDRSAPTTDGRERGASRRP